MRRYTPKEQSIADIKQAIQNGALSVEAIAEQTGLAVNTVEGYAYKSGIKLPKRKEQLNEKRDALIKGGFPSKEIAAQEDVTRQAIDDYAARTGQKEIWKQNKKKRKQTIRDLINYLNYPVISLAGMLEQLVFLKLSEEDKWAYYKTKQYYHSKRYSSYPFNTLFTIFRSYHDAEVNGEKLSLEKLCEDFDNIYPAGVRKILRTVGEKSLFGSRERTVTPRYKSEAIRRSYSLEMNCSDIGFFLDLAYYVVNRNMKRLSGKTGKRPEIRNWIASFGQSKKVTYKISSQIFEAQDLNKECDWGFSDAELIELLDTSEKVYNYVNAHRDNIAPKIIHALQAMFPDRHITKPYRDFKV